MSNRRPRGDKVRAPKPDRSTLATVFLRALVQQRVVIELRNESVVEGKLEHVFANSNMALSDVKLRWTLEPSPTSPGTVLDTVTIMGKHVRYVHIPDSIDMQNVLMNRARASRKGALAYGRYDTKKK